MTPPPEPLPPPRGDTGARVDLEAGLASLPSSRQVLASVPFGRNDPFEAPASPAAPSTPATGRGSRPAASAPAAASASAGRDGSAASGTPATATASGPSRSKAAAPAGPLQPPQGFQLTGVIRSGGKAEALVAFGASSGSLRPGDRGGRSTGLLPAGWSLGAIHFGGSSPADPPSVILLRGSQRVKVSL